MIAKGRHFVWRDHCTVELSLKRIVRGIDKIVQISFSRDVYLWKWPLDGVEYVVNPRG